MPCAKGMSECRRGCLHRRLVEEYRIARHAQVLEEERETVGGRGELAARKEAGTWPITFKEWIIGQGRNALGPPDDETWSR